MFCQIALLCWAASAVLSAPTEVQQPTVIPIISQSEELEPNGTFKFSYETGNGIKREEISYDKIVPKVRGQSDASNEGGESDESDEIHVQQGSYSYTAPDGTVITLRYIADENGFQAFGDHLPRAPAPVQVSSSLSDKSGRALKTLDSAEAASIPVSAVKPVAAPEPAEPAPNAAQSSPEVLPEAPQSTPEPAEPTPNAAQSAPEVLPEAPQSAPEPAEPAPNAAQSPPEVLPEAPQSASAAPEPLAVEKSSEIKPETTEVSVPVQNAEESSSTIVPELVTEVAEQSSTGSVVDQSSNVEEQSSIAVEQLSTKVVEESSTIIAADQSAPVTNQPAVAAEESQSTVNAITDSPVDLQPSTGAEEELASNTNDVQSSATVAAEESSTIISANPAEQSASIPESEQQVPTEAALVSEDPVSATVSV